MSISYKQGARCLLKHCFDLHDKSLECKRKFVRSTILSPNTNGITRILSRTNGPVNKSFECSGEPANCGCCHAEIKAILDLVSIVHHPVFQYIMLSSYSPCTSCSNAIIMSNAITAVIYDKIQEHDLRGVERLQQVIPTFTVRKIEEIANGSHRGELCFIKRWGQG